MESPLDVLSRAATMLHKHGDAAAEPTTNPEDDDRKESLRYLSKRRRLKFRHLYVRDTPTRSHSFNEKTPAAAFLASRGSKVYANDNKLRHSDSDLTVEADDDAADFSDSEQTAGSPEGESPLDMSMKMKGSPPSYSQAISSGHVFRPSVITQSISTPVNKYEVNRVGVKGEYVPGSISMCDPVIDEHFRRSLGENYMMLFNKGKDVTDAVMKNDKDKAPPPKDRGSSPIMFPRDPCINYLTSNSITSKNAVPLKSDPEISNSVKMETGDEPASLNVDDHFAKALGDTWKKIQEKLHKDPEGN